MTENILELDAFLEDDGKRKCRYISKYRFLPKPKGNKITFALFTRHWFSVKIEESSESIRIKQDLLLLAS